MSQTKAQLIQPIGIVTAGGVVVTGVVTASSFDGDVVGSATSIISGGNLNLGDVNATTFSGDFTGTATGINTGADIKVGQFTASSFTGDFTGTATSMFRGTGFKAGAVNATGFNVSGTSAGNITGNVTGNITGNVTGVSTGNVTGNVTGNITGYAKSVTSGANIHVGVLTAISFSGDGSNLSGIAATNYNTQTDSVPDISTFSINVTASGSSNYTLSGTDRSGSVSGSDPTVTVEVGDTLNFVVDASGHPFYIRVSDGGANVSTPAATNQGSQSGTVSWTPNTAGTYYYQCGNHSGMIGTIIVTGSIIDLSAGNMITLTQNASATVAFANTDTAMDVTIIHKLAPSSFSSGGVIFDATGDYLSLSDSADFDLGSGDFTIECWVYGTTFGGYAGIIGQWPQSGGNANNAWVLETVGNDIDFYYCHDGTNIVGLEGPTLSTNQWHHLAVTRSGNTVRIFKDGVSNQDHTVTHTFNNSTGDVTIGGDVAGGGYLGGTISNLRLIKGTALYTGSFYPPFEELTNVTNTKLLCCQSTSDATVGAVKPGTITANGDASALSVNVSQSSSGTKTLTWPTSVKWNGGSAPTLINDASREGDSQQFQFITRDAGLNWYAWEPFKIDRENGLLFTAGKNEYGALGLNAPESSHKSSPTQIGTNINWSKIVGGGQGNYYGMGLKEDGTLWGWGRNNYGQMGQNSVGGGGGPSNHGFSSPVQIPGTWGGGQFAGGAGIIMTKTDGTLWQWGGGVSGNNNNVSYSSPIQIGTDTDWSNNDGAVGGAGNNRLVIKTDGTIWTWGYNEYGELGLNEAGPSGPGTWRSSPTQIGTDATWASAAPSGMHDNAAIKTDGTLWTWGRNHQGQLGQGNQTQYSSPRQVGTNTTWSRVVSSAYNCMLAVKTDNTLWMWGLNSSGMLGQNQTSGNYSSPKQIPGSWVAGNNKFDNAVYSTIAIKGDGSLWAWGANPYGELGQNNTTQYSSPIQVGSSTNWDTVSANMDFWCAVEKSN